jgi:hypothetical protein
VTDFKRVLLTDKLAWELFGLAARDRLLYRTGADDEPPTPQRRSLGQRALSLLVLFDKVLVHDFSEGAFRIPDLESEGVVQVVARGNPVGPVQPLQTYWRRGPLKNRSRPPRLLLKSLQLFKEERVLVVTRLLSVKSDWQDALSAALGVSRRKFLNAFFDYALACVEGDQVVLRESILNRLPDDMLADFTRRLFDFQRENDVLDELNANLVFAIAFADEVRIIQELSSQFGVGVATEHYRSKYASNPSPVDPRTVAGHFVVVRTALADDRGVLPQIRDIRHALALRRDPHLRSLREMLVEFHRSVQQGDVKALESARREITGAKRALARRASWKRRLDWVSYFALPVGVAEALTGIPPIAGLSLAALGATGAAAMSHAKKRHDWVLFNL